MAGLGQPRLCKSGHRPSQRSAVQASLGYSVLHATEWTPLCGPVLAVGYSCLLLPAGWVRLS